MPDPQNRASLPDQDKPDPVRGTYPADWAAKNIAVEFEDTRDLRQDLKGAMEIIRLIACGTDAWWAVGVESHAEEIGAALGRLEQRIGEAREALNGGTDGR